MKIPPPTPTLSLHLLGRIFTLFGALAILTPPAMSAEHFSPIENLKHSIPPGMDDLDTAQNDYEKTSKTLQQQFEVLEKNAGACAQGSKLAGQLKKAGPAQKHQRDRIVKVLNQSKADIQSEVAKLDGIGAEASHSGESEKGNVKMSKVLIETGVSKPQGLINREIAHVKSHNEKMEKFLAITRLALNGNARECVKARTAFFENIRPQALKLPERLKKVVDALEAHKKSLGDWADKVEQNLSSSRGRSPASR